MHAAGKEKDLLVLLIFRENKIEFLKEMFYI